MQQYINLSCSICTYYIIQFYFLQQIYYNIREAADVFMLCQSDALAIRSTEKNNLFAESASKFMMIPPCSDVSAVSRASISLSRRCFFSVSKRFYKYSGYRFYDGNSLVRMQEILFYRELDFSLKSISDILSMAEIISLCLSPE